MIAGLFNYAFGPRVAGIQSQKCSQRHQEAAASAKFLIGVPAGVINHRSYLVVGRTRLCNTLARPRNECLFQLWPEANLDRPSGSCGSSLRSAILSLANGHAAQTRRPLERILWKAKIAISGDQFGSRFTGGPMKNCLQCCQDSWEPLHPKANIRQPCRTQAKLIPHRLIRLILRPLRHDSCRGRCSILWPTLGKRLMISTAFRS